MAAASSRAHLREVGLLRRLSREVDVGDTLIPPGVLHLLVCHCGGKFAMGNQRDGGRTRLQLARFGAVRVAIVFDCHVLPCPWPCCSSVR